MIEPTRDDLHPYKLERAFFPERALRKNLADSLQMLAVLVPLLEQSRAELRQFGKVPSELEGMAFPDPALIRQALDKLKDGGASE